jgi:hypothetical protein
MKILYDLSSTQPVSSSGSDFHGGSEYAKTVFYRLAETLPLGKTLEVFYDPKRKIDNSIIEACKTRQFTIHHCKNNSEISALLNNNSYDVFYSALPYSYTNLVIPEKTKFIYTIHGLRDLEYPADIYELKYKKQNLKSKIKHFLFLLFPLWWKSNRLKSRTNNYNKIFSLTSNRTIVTVSSHSKYSLLYFFPALTASEIKVLYSPAKIHEDINNADSGKDGKYILVISGDRSEKGAYRACKVLYKLVKQDKLPKDVKIIVLGVTNTGAYKSVTGNSSRFELRSYVCAPELESLYKNAQLFLYPTLNEGFGYPPMEAMKYGTLCACSANSAVTGICGDAVLYFNPFDETEMSIRILQSFDDDIKKEKSEKMLQRFKYISDRQKQDLDLLVKEILL